MKRKILLLIMSVTLVTTIFTSCGNTTTNNNTPKPKDSYSSSENSATKTSYPVNFDAFDSKGNIYKETFNEAPKKIITNNQSSTELLLTLGLKDSLIGTGDLDTPIPENLLDDYNSIPSVAKKGDVAKEVVIGSGTDLVIGRSASFEDNRYGSISSLNQAGINTYVQLASKMNAAINLNTIIQDVKNVGVIFNVQDKANELADSLQETLDKVKSKVPNNGERKKVLLVVNYSGAAFTVYGANASLQKEMLNVLNADNVVEKGGSVSFENVISANPDYIVYVTANKNSATDNDAIDRILSESTIQNVNAIKNKNIISVDYTELMGYGIRTFDCLEKLASAFYPENFKS
ncbi:ABC transporter substrate-binding protein [Clostridium saccharoperbutylacetonicum]|uniref:ABC transporter substrate-binding protein n=1 Tax=Clostridium saccharoperbutylacetonicum TaxID=36745 RepID=UPI0039E974C8